MAAYSMPFSLRDVLASYPSAQLSAVDRDTEIFKFGQVLTKSKNPKARLIAGRALSKVSPGYQEAQIERLAGDNFSQKQFQAEQRESMALQKKYIEDRSSYMEQKTGHRLLRQALVKGLGTPSTQRGTPFSEMELEEQTGGGGSAYGGGGSAYGGSGAATPRSSSSFMGKQLSSSMVAAMEGGLSASFWGGGSAGSMSGRQSEAGSGSWEGEEFGLGVEPVNLNMDPTRLAQLEILRSNVLGDRLREGAIGSLLGEMVSGVSGEEAVRQYQANRTRLEELGQAAMRSGMPSLGEIANPNDLNEADIRTMARFQAANRGGFFGRSELRSDLTYAESPFEQESNAFSYSIEAEFGQQPDPDFGSAGSLALASGGGGAVRRRGRPAGYTMSEESRAKIGETRRARTLTGRAADEAMSRALMSTGRAGIATITSRAMGPYAEQQAARQRAEERRRKEEEGAGGFSLFD
jgi:ribosomal protein L12E/L44/L45/RPP1/RPP2